MNNEVMPFDFKGNQVRTVMIDNEPYFVANDVAEILGYKNKYDSVKRHVDEEDRCTIVFHDSGVNPKKVMVNESGLYSLILASKLPAAKEFKRWVTNDVLKSIRKYGSYQPKQLSAIEQLKLATQSVGELDDRVTNLEDNQYLNPGEYAYLGRLISKKVYEYLSINNYELSKKQIGKLFKDINSGIKQITNISTRSQLRNKDFDRVEKYVREWIPSKATLVIIEEMKEKVTKL